MPFSRGGHAAAGGSFTVLRFSEPEVPDVVYLEQLTSALYLDKREDVDHYMEVMNHLSTEALTPAQSARFLTELIRDYPDARTRRPLHATHPEGFPVTDVSSSQGEPEPPRAAIDTTVPHSARIWNYWLGGNDNYAVDREAGDEYREIFPGIAVVARTSRGFLTRAVRYLAGEAGIRQFLDIGTGLPSADNTHEVAQRIAPDSKIVYVDNDPLVLAHARALLTSSPQGDCEYLDADIRNPDAILAAAAGLLDFTQPIALMLMGIMGHFTDDEAYPIVARLQAGLPSGSYFALYDGASTNEAFNQAQQGYNETGAVPYYLRSPEQFAPFFEGLELIEPGMVPVPHWRPDPGAEPAEIYSYCGVGRKP